MPYKPTNPPPKPRLPILDDPAVAPARVVSPAETCQILHSGPTRVNQLIHSGALRSYMDGSLRKVFLSSILEYQAAQVAAPPKQPKPRPAEAQKPELPTPKAEPLPQAKLKSRQRLKPWRAARRGRAR
jgi:hypothetical protein